MARCGAVRVKAPLLLPQPTALVKVAVAQVMVERVVPAVAQAVPMVAHHMGHQPMTLVRVVEIPQMPVEQLLLAARVVELSPSLQLQ